MYVVTGATGHTGSVVADALLAAGKQVRVVGRDANRLQRFTAKGAQPFIADVTDSAAITKAFSGADVAYLMIPPSPSAPDVRAYEDRAGDSFVSAIQKSGTKHAVLLSSIGADKSDKTGPVVALYNLEQKLNSIPDLNALYLRAGYFMENLLPQVGVINSFGFVAGPVRGDLPLPMIATRDIGAVAANGLLKLNFQGKQVRELQGAREVTYNQVANLIGSAIGKPGLIYQQLPPVQLKPALLQMGMSNNMADLLIEMADSLNTGHMRSLEPRSAATTTPTTIETWLNEVFVPAYRGKAATA
jgi:uncharacterized protein YbjT (DUF2867 family)